MLAVGGGSTTCDGVVEALSDAIAKVGAPAAHRRKNLLFFFCHVCFVGT